jgi:hypothetical protein
VAECVLCGATIGRNTRSQEHIFAKWIRDLFPDTGRTKQKRKTQLRGDALQVEEWEDTPLNVRVKDVCKPCNNEWCEAIDTEAQPVLEPMIRGRAARLDPAEQLIVAVWANKTFLLLQRTHKDHRRSIPDSEYRWFREHRWPLANEQVWIGQYDGTGDWPISYHHYGFELFDRAAGPPVDSPDVVHGYVIAFTVGHLLFRAFGHIVKDGPTVMPGGPFVTVLRQVWPASGDTVEWPPVTVVSGDGGLHALIAVFDDSWQAHHAPPS